MPIGLLWVVMTPRVELCFVSFIAAVNAYWLKYMHTCSLFFNMCLNDTAVEPRALFTLTES